MKSAVDNSRPRNIYSKRDKAVDNEPDDRNRSITMSALKGHENLKKKLSYDKDLLRDIEDNVSIMNICLNTNPTQEISSSQRNNTTDEIDMDELMHVKDQARKKAEEALQLQKQQRKNSFNTLHEQMNNDIISSKFDTEHRSFITETDDIYDDISPRQQPEQKQISEQNPTKIQKQHILTNNNHNLQPPPPQQQQPPSTRKSITKTEDILQSVQRHNNYRLKLQETKQKRLQEEKKLTYFHALPNPNTTPLSSQYKTKYEHNNNSHIASSNANHSHVNTNNTNTNTNNMTIEQREISNISNINDIKMDLETFQNMKIQQKIAESKESQYNHRMVNGNDNSNGSGGNDSDGSNSDRGNAGNTTDTDNSQHSSPTPTPTPRRQRSTSTSTSPNSSRKSHTPRPLTQESWEQAKKRHERELARQVAEQESRMKIIEMKQDLKRLRLEEKIAKMKESTKAVKAENIKAEKKARKAANLANKTEKVTITKDEISTSDTKPKVKTKILQQSQSKFFERNFEFNEINTMDRDCDDYRRISLFDKNNGALNNNKKTKKNNHKKSSSKTSKNDDEDEDLESIQFGINDPNDPNEIWLARQLKLLQKRKDIMGVDGDNGEVMSSQTQSQRAAPPGVFEPLYDPKEWEQYKLQQKIYKNQQRDGGEVGGDIGEGGTPNDNDNGDGDGKDDDVEEDSKDNGDDNSTHRAKGTVRKTKSSAGNGIGIGIGAGPDSVDPYVYSDSDDDDDDDNVIRSKLRQKHLPSDRNKEDKNVQTDDEDDDDGEEDGEDSEQQQQPTLSISGRNLGMCHNNNTTNNNSISNSNGNINDLNISLRQWKNETPMTTTSTSSPSKGQSVAESQSQSQAQARVVGPLREDDEEALRAADQRALAPYFSYERGDKSSFFDPSSTLEVGRFRVRDAREFNTKSMHRKPDTDSAAVTLLKGVRRDTGEEQVITLLFDRRFFSREERAQEWWNQNKDRFL
eukprot:gene4342-8639_t